MHPFLLSLHLTYDDADSKIKPTPHSLRTVLQSCSFLPHLAGLFGYRVTSVAVSLSLVLATGISPRSEQIYLAFVIVWVVGSMLILPFRRRIGGAGGGSEKEIVGVTWFLLAIATGVCFAAQQSAAIG